MSKSKVLEEYYMKIGRIEIIIFIVSIIIGADIVPLTKFLGCFANLPWKNVVILNLFITIPEIMVFLHLYKNINDIKKNMVLKRFFIGVAVINYWAFIKLFPSAALWILGIYFAILMAFFLDTKLSLIINIILSISMIITLFVYESNFDYMEYLLQEGFIYC